jgi:signal transduction histidine kinase
LQGAGARVDRPGDDGAGLRIRADRRLLVHALVNLLKNAVEAARGAGVRPRIGLGVVADDNRVVLEVADNGPGIPADALGRIFDLGYSTKGAGRGRGLAIVRESILAQHGVIDVASTPAAGTTFRITLPSAGIL